MSEEQIQRSNERMQALQNALEKIEPLVKEVGFQSDPLGEVVSFSLCLKEFEVVFTPREIPRMPASPSGGLVEDSEQEEADDADEPVILPFVRRAA